MKKRSLRGNTSSVSINKLGKAQPPREKTIGTRTGFAAIVTALCIAVTSAVSAQRPETHRTPNDGHVVRAADVIAYDAAGTLWNYGNMYFPGTPPRRQVGPAGAVIPKSFFVADWR